MTGTGPKVALGVTATGPKVALCVTGANNDPNADSPAACLWLGTTIITNKRHIEGDDFFKGLFETALEPDKIITKATRPRVAFCVAGAGPKVALCILGTGPTVAFYVTSHAYAPCGGSEPAG